MSDLIFEKSIPGRVGVTLPALTPAEADCPLRIPEKYFAKEPPELPELSELDVVRHFTNLSRRNFSVDGNFYPLGSCTMKYNPKIGEKIAGLDGFAQLHPLLPQLRGGGMLTQGALGVLYETEQWLCEIMGMHAFCLQPLAGAHGELTGMMLAAAYHQEKGNAKSTVLIPDSAHGTNPSSAHIAGYDVKTVPTADDGCMDLKHLETMLDDGVAAIMLTCPNTLGLFNPRLEEVVRLARRHDALLYGDGANLNALLGHARPGDLGFDIVHTNLHKTFSTPHGGGGPGAGPVGVSEALEPYLPTSRIVKRSDGTYELDYDRPKTIGFIAPFYGNFGVILRAYAYMLMLGAEGLRRVSEHAVLNANYVQAKLKDDYHLPYDRHCMHECVLSASRQAANGVHAVDIAKALIDRGIHPPTVYFPLIIDEAMMIEPTETESPETLDVFIDAMKAIAAQARDAPESFAELPLTTPVARMDEVQAARKPVLSA